MCLDVETNKYNHNFHLYIKDPEDDLSEEDSDDSKRSKKKNVENVCSICKDSKEKHFDFKVEENLNSLFGDHNQNLVSNNKSNNLKLTTINKDLIEKLDLEFKDKNLCIICYSNELQENNSISFPCGHQFCKDCVKTYIENMLNNNKVDKIKCLMAGCVNMLPDTTPKEVLSLDKYNKFKMFRRRAVFYSNMSRGLIPCSHPDCEEWIVYKDGDDISVECANLHQFCAKCKGKWHSKGTCNDVNLMFILF